MGCTNGNYEIITIADPCVYLVQWRHIEQWSQLARDARCDRSVNLIGAERWEAPNELETRAAPPSWPQHARGVCTYLNTGAGRVVHFSDIYILCAVTSECQIRDGQRGWAFSAKFIDTYKDVPDDANPRPDGGLSHLRQGVWGGGLKVPCLNWKLIEGYETGNRQSKV